MTRQKRRVLIWLGAIFGVFVVIAAGLVIFILTLDQSKLKNYVSSTVSAATGRQLTINGDLKFDLGWITKVSVSGIQFQNVEWSKHPQMAEVGLFDVEVDLWQLIRHFRVVMPTITISEPKVILEKRADGAPNWEFRTPVTKPVTPQKRTEFPVIQKLIIKGGSLRLDDQASKTQIDLKVIDAEGAGFLDAPVKLKAEGTYQKMPLTLSFDGGSYENLLSSKQPYPVKINLDVGKLKANINGNMIEPLEMK